MKRLIIIFILLFFVCACEKVESRNENALSYRNGKCLVFYPDNNEQIKTYAQSLCEDKEKRVIDYSISNIGEFYLVSYDDNSFYTEKDFSEIELKIVDRLDIVSNILRYQMKIDDIDLAYTSKFWIDTDENNIDVSDVIIRKEDNNLLMYFPKYGYQVVLDLCYGQDIIGRDFGVKKEEYEMKYYLNPNRPMVALTYDDGPYRPVDSLIYDTMEKYGAKCTFYIVGSRLGPYELETVQMGIDLGLEFGSHSMNHENISKLSYSEAYYTINSVSDYVYNKLAYKMNTYRPPYGSRNIDLENGIDMISVLWNVDSKDWANRDIDATYYNIINKVDGSDVILMHALYESTGYATQRLVPDLMDRGFQLVTVSELIDNLNINSNSFGGR